MIINQINKNNYNERNNLELTFSEHCLAIPEILEKIFMYSSLSGMGNLSQVSQSINQTAKALQNKENYPKTYQKILLQVFADLFKKPAEEITSRFISLSEKNKNWELEFLINSQKFNEIDLVFFGNILLQATHKGYEYIVNELIDSSRFKEINGRDLGIVLHQAVFNGHEQIAEALINSQKFNEIDLDSFSIILPRVAREGYEQIAETLISSQKFNEIDLDSLGKSLQESAEKGHVQIVKKLMGSSRF